MGRDAGKVNAAGAGRENECGRTRARERASASKSAKQADRGRAGQVWFVKRAAMVRDAVKVNFAGAGRENERERTRASERASASKSARQDERGGRGQGW